MSISEPFIRRPIGTALLAVGLLMIGVVAFPMLPIAPLPQVDFPTIQVSATLPGASAETMAASVTTPLERQFALIAGVTELTSTSSLGSSSITVQFNLDRNIDAAAGDIQSAINAAGGQLPTNLPSPPSYRKVNPADSPILLLALTSTSLPLTVIDDSADTILAQQLSQISGVAQVTINGAAKTCGAYSARASKDGIARSFSRGRPNADRRLPPLTLPRALSTARGKASPSTTTIRSSPQCPGTMLSLPTVTARRCASAISVKRWTGRRTPSLPPGRTARACILLAVFKQPGANVIDTVDQVRAALPHLRCNDPSCDRCCDPGRSHPNDPRLGR